MAKKKKTQLKPVARGFATTSVPKKAIPEPDPTTSTAEPETTVSDTTLDNSGSAQASGQPDDAASQVDPEQEFLQAFIDKYQDRTEKEISRTLKVCVYSFMITSRAHG